MAEENRSFDVLGTAYDPRKDYVSALIQCFNDINSRPVGDGPNPRAVSGKFLCKRHGDSVMLEYHLMDNFLNDPRRCEEFVKESHKAIGALATQLKREFKKYTKTALTLKERKDSQGYNREQVSLNDRWYLRVWRVYDLSPEVTQPNDGD